MQCRPSRRSEHENKAWLEAGKMQVMCVSKHEEMDCWGGGGCIYVCGAREPEKALQAGEIYNEGKTRLAGRARHLRIESKRLAVISRVSRGGFESRSRGVRSVFEEQSIHFGVDCTAARQTRGLRASCGPLRKTGLVCLGKRTSRQQGSRLENWVGFECNGPLTGGWHFDAEDATRAAIKPWRRP